MINFIPRIFKEEVYLLGMITAPDSEEVLLYISTLTPYFPAVYIVKLCKKTKYVLEIRTTDVMWVKLNLDIKSAKLYSSILSGMVEQYKDHRRQSKDKLLVKEFKRSKPIQPGAQRLDVLQELLRLNYIRDLTRGGVTGSRCYSVSNPSHLKRLVGDYHAELGMTFGDLLPLPKELKEDPENDEIIGRMLELFLQGCKKLNFLIERQHAIDEEIETKDIFYTFMKARKSLPLFQHLMNPFISMKF